MGKMRYYTVRWSYTIHPEHGFGIFFDTDDGQSFRKCFFEDGTLAPAKGIPDMKSEIGYLERFANDSWGYHSRGQSETEHQTLMKKASCSFHPAADNALEAVLTAGNMKALVRI